MKTDVNIQIHIHTSTQNNTITDTQENHDRMHSNSKMVGFRRVAYTYYIYIQYVETARELTRLRIMHCIKQHFNFAASAYSISFGPGSPVGSPASAISAVMPLASPSTPQLPDGSLSMCNTTNEGLPGFPKGVLTMHDMNLRFFD